MSQQPTPNSNITTQTKKPNSTGIRRYYPTSLFAKLVCWFFAVTLVLLLLIYYAIGTTWGTHTLLNAITHQTGIILKIGDGNLRDGLWLYDLQIQHNNSNPVSVYADKAYIKIGWRSLLNQQIHLNQIQADTVIVKNHQPASNKPFSYPKITLPFDLTLDNVKADLVRYQQLSSDVTLDFNNALVKDFTWRDSELKFQNAKLDINNILNIDKAIGKIDLQNNYSLDVKAQVHIYALDHAYFGKIDGQVTGGLDLLKGKFKSDYNKSVITGEINAKPLEYHMPFDAKITWQDAPLPYLGEQNIHLKNGTATATGNLDSIDIQANGDLTANNISAQYQGSATTDLKTLKIHEFNTTLPEGNLSTTGVIDWQNRVNISLTNTANNLLIQNLLPKDIAPFAPKTLDGQIDFALDVATKQEPLFIKTKLIQNNGETIQAVIKNRSGKNTPYHITANWQNFVRHNVVNIGDIISPTGQATITYQPSNKQKEQIDIQVTAKIEKFNIAPTGDYQINLTKINEKIDINELVYQGVAGGLQAKGAINLANRKTPFSWQIHANPKQFDMHKVVPTVPVSELTGEIVATGVIKDLAKVSEHDITIEKVDILGKMQARKQQKNAKFLNLTGKGNAKLQLAGTDLQHLSAKFDGSLDAPNLPKGMLKLDIAGNLQQMNIDDFVHQSGNSHLSAKGKLDLRNGVGWDMKANLKQFDSSFFAPNLPSNITGSFNSHGSWHTQQQIIDLNDLNLTGRLKNQAISATGNLIAKLKLPNNLENLQKILDNSQNLGKNQRLIETLKADNLSLKWGNNRISATGDEKQLIASVDISTLNQLIPSLKGMVRGGVVFSQPSQQSLPNVMIDLIGRNVSLPNFVMLDSKIKGEVINLAHQPSHLEIVASGLNIANQPIKEIVLKFDGTQAQHQLDIKTDSSKGNVQVSLKGAINLSQKTWQGVLGNGQIGTKYAKLQQTNPTQMHLNWQNPSMALASHCWQMLGNSGKLCFNEDLTVSEQQGKVNFSLQNIDSQIFGVVLPNDIAWSGKLNGKALLNWQKNQKPMVNASFYSDNGKIGTAPQSPDELATTIAYERVSLIARSGQHGLKLRADVKTANGAGNGYFDATINPNIEQKPIDGTLVFEQIHLPILKPFFPAFERLTGTALVAGKVNGTLIQPKFVGDIEIQDASLSVIGLPMRMDNINILASVVGNQAKVTGDFSTPANGNGLITGTVDWVNELQAKLNITGENLQLSQPPLLTAKINPMFDIIVRPQRRAVEIVGVVDIPEAVIRPPQASEEIITQSPDVNVIDRRLAGQIDEVLKVTKPWAINADIGIDLGKKVTFQGFGAKLPLAGALHLSQRGQGAMQAKGVVQVAKRSKVEIFGQNLDLNFAQVRFNGSVANPSVNVQATKDIQGTKTGVKVTGQVAKPNIVVFNDGGLTEQQAMNALVTGSLNNAGGQNTNEQDFRTRVNNTLAAAGLSFGLSSTRGLTNEIGRAFGLQSLILDASGTGSDTLVSITGYITPDLFIRYGVGVFTSQPELSMRYQLTRRLYIEGKSAINNAIDLIYRWRY